MIECEDVTFGYRPDEAVIEGFTYRFEPGTVTALVGASGTGKSTLLYLCGLLLNPWSGTIRIDGTDQYDLNDAGRSRLRAHGIGFVFQDAALDPTRTVVDNIIEGALYAGLDTAVARQRADTLMEQVGVTMRGDHRPGEVSGGQAQRVALCRALLNDPANILADEPTGNLDPDNGQVVSDMLAMAASAGRTVVIATHDRDLATIADRILPIGT